MKQPGHQLSSAPLLNPEARCVSALPFCQTLLNVACAKGADKNKVLRGTGIFDADLMQERAFSPLQIAALMLNADKYAGVRDFAFQTGQALATSQYSGVLKAMGYSKNLRQALLILRRFTSHISPLVSFGVYPRPQGIVITLRDSAGKHKAFDVASLMVCSAFIALTKQWCGQRLPLSFHFPFSRPRHIAEFEMHLGRRLHFDSPCFYITVDNASLRKPFLHHDGYLLKASVSHYKKQLISGVQLPDFIRNEVMRNPHLCATDLASALDISPATLKRRLKACHCTFSALVDDVRREQAIFLLQICRLSNEESALRLAISDLTNFRRAVKRWTGLTPGELRSR